MLDQINLTGWVATIGYIGVLTIIFLETAVFFFFFLPGDSLLFAAGYLAAKGVFSLPVLIPGIAGAAFLGYTIAYWFGIRLGHWLMRRPDSVWFKKKYMTQSHLFYEKHGGKALLLGRLIPVIRTFIPITAGMAEMEYHRYLMFNLFGAAVWATFVPLLGYYIGGLVPNSQKYVLPIVLLIVLISISPAIIKWWQYKRKKC